MKGLRAGIIALNFGLLAILVARVGAGLLGPREDEDDPRVRAALEFTPVAPPAARGSGGGLLALPALKALREDSRNRGEDEGIIEPPEPPGPAGGPLENHFRYAPAIYLGPGHASNLALLIPRSSRQSASRSRGRAGALSRRDGSRACRPGDRIQLSPAERRSEDGSGNPAFFVVDVRPEAMIYEDASTRRRYTLSREVERPYRDGVFHLGSPGSARASISDDPPRTETSSVRSWRRPEIPKT